MLTDFKIVTGTLDGNLQKRLLNIHHTC